MTAHNATTKLPNKNAMRKKLGDDPYIRAVYRAQSIDDVDTIVNSFGITDPQHRAAMLGMMKLNWVLIRRLERIL